MAAAYLEANSIDVTVPGASVKLAFQEAFDQIDHERASASLGTILAGTGSPQDTDTVLKSAHLLTRAELQSFALYVSRDEDREGNVTMGLDKAAAFLERVFNHPSQVGPEAAYAMMHALSPAFSPAQHTHNLGLYVLNLGKEAGKNGFVAMTKAIARMPMTAEQKASVLTPMFYRMPMEIEDGRSVDARTQSATKLIKSFDPAFSPTRGDSAVPVTDSPTEEAAFGRGISVTPDRMPSPTGSVEHSDDGSSVSAGSDREEGPPIKIESRKERIDRMGGSTPPLSVSADSIPDWR